MRTLFKRSKIKSGDLQKLYELSFSYVLNESVVLWQLSQVFLLGNTVLSGFIVTILSQNGNQNNLGLVALSLIGLVALSLIGIIVSILWLFSYARTSKYYEFRIVQAKQREPENWMLFNEDGEYFSEGDTIEIKGKKFNFWIWKFSSLLLVKFLAFLFIIFYITIIAFLYTGLIN